MLQNISKPAREPLSGSKTHYAHLGEPLTVMIKGALIGLAFGLWGQKKCRFLFFKLGNLVCNVSMFSLVVHKFNPFLTDQTSHRYNGCLEHFVMWQTCCGVCTNTCDPCVIPPLQRSNPSACQIKTRCLTEVLMTAQPQNSTRHGCRVRATDSGEQLSAESSSAQVCGRGGGGGGGVFVVANVLI